MEQREEQHEVINAEAVEIISDSQEEQPLAPYSPFQEEEVNVKAYTKSAVDPKDANAPIPEPVFTPPPMNAGQQQAGNTPPSTPPPPVNPQLKDLPQKEKTNAAKQAAAMVMNGYEALHQFGNWTLTIDEKNLKKMERNNELDMNIPIPVNGRFVPLEAWINAYNSQTSDSFTVSKSFKEEATPVLERVFEKKGIGMTDEQTLIYLFSKDLAVKGIQWAALRSTRKDTLNQLKDLTEAYRTGTIKFGGHQSAPSTPPPPPQSNPEPPASQESYQPEYSAPPPPPNIPEYDFSKSDEVSQTDEDSEGSYVQTPSGEVVNEQDLTVQAMVERTINPDGHAAKQEERAKRKYTKRTDKKNTDVMRLTEKPPRKNRINPDNQ